MHAAHATHSAAASGWARAESCGGGWHAQLTLSNGLRVYLLEDHDVPLVKASLLFRGGMRTSPPDKVARVLQTLQDVLQGPLDGQLSAQPCHNVHAGAA